MRPLVVIPTYDEVDNIVEAIERVRAAVPDASVLVVDDNSPDGTADLVDDLADDLADEQPAATSAIDVLRRPDKDGLGSAYRAGFAWGLARGHDVLVQMDADLSHDPAALPSLLRAVDDGADLAIGSRYVPGGSIPDWAWHRKALSRWGNRYASAMLRLSVADATAGYRAYRASLLELLDLPSVRADGYGFQIEMTYRSANRGARIVEVPIAFTDRTKGSSKMSSTIIVEALALVTWWGVGERMPFRR
ncbi:MAG: polyprenol monophosphomannose synthase [Acidimicrobiales bacterium]|nr:polyprenol monophosphomannose synthase [Acidimicrobiales bacterium]